MLVTSITAEHIVALREKADTYVIQGNYVCVWISRRAGDVYAVGDAIMGVGRAKLFLFGDELEMLLYIEHIQQVAKDRETLHARGQTKNDVGAAHAHGVGGITT